MKIVTAGRENIDAKSTGAEAHPDRQAYPHSVQTTAETADS